MQVVEIDGDIELDLHETTRAHRRPKEQTVFGDRGEVESSRSKDDEAKKDPGTFIAGCFGRISASSLNDAKVQYQKKKKKENPICSVSTNTPR